MDLLFGVSLIPSPPTSSGDPVRDAQHAEELGFDLVSVWDHPFVDTPSLETWTLLTWVAARASRIGLLTNVLALPHRPPILLAKMAETLDRMSGGRLILGLGSGSAARDFGALGLPGGTPGERIAALEEAVRLIRTAWTEPEVDFRGEHLSTSGARLEPKPARPIPIWLGVYGNRALGVAGRVADGWLPSLAYVGEIKPKMDRIRRAAEEAGRDPAGITFAFNVGVRIGGEPSDDPTKVKGSAERVAERLAGFAREGFTVLNLWVAGDRAEQRELLAREVIPAVRELVG